MKPRFARESRVLRTLAHPARLAILEHLRGGSACVCHLTAALARPQAYVSQQLAILRDAGFIEGRRNGTFIDYSLRDYSVLGMLDFVTRFAGGEPSGAPRAAGAVEGCECPRCRGGAAAATGARR